jgi:chromosome segregation ATPase
LAPEAKGVVMGTMIERMQALESRVGELEDDVRHAVEEEGLLRRLEALEQQVKANEEKRHFGEGELRGYNQALERAVAHLEARLPAPIPVVTPLAHAGAALPDYLLAPTPDYSSDLPADAEPCGCEEAEQLRAELGRAQTRIDIDASTIAQLTARAEAAEREKDESRAYAVSCSTQAQALSGERDAAETEIASLRAELERTVKQSAENFKARRELAAELERLLAESAEHPSEPDYKQLLGMIEFWRERCQEAEASSDEFGQYTEAKRLSAQLAAANALLGRCAVTLEPDRSLTHDIRRHLSGQPAAKSVPCDDCGAIHGTGNTNSLCPKASNYSPEFARREGTID